MRVRATIHLSPDAAGFAPAPGQEFDVDADQPDVVRYMNAGFLVPIVHLPMRDDLRPSRRRPETPVAS